MRFPRAFSTGWIRLSAIRVYDHSLRRPRPHRRESLHGRPDRDRVFLSLIEVCRIVAQIALLPDTPPPSCLNPSAASQTSQKSKLRSADCGARTAPTPSRSTSDKGPSGLFFSRARRPPTECRIPGTASRARSRISIPATARCAANTASGRRAGTPMACPSRLRYARNSGFTRKPRSRRTESSRSSTAVRNRFGGT